MWYVHSIFFFFVFLINLDPDRQFEGSINTISKLLVTHTQLPTDYMRGIWSDFLKIKIGEHHSGSYCCSEEEEKMTINEYRESWKSVTGGCITALAVTFEIFSSNIHTYTTRMSYIYAYIRTYVHFQKSEHDFFLANSI